MSLEKIKQTIYYYGCPFTDQIDSNLKQVFPGNENNHEDKINAMIQAYIIVFEYHGWTFNEKQLKELAELEISVADNITNDDVIPTIAKLYSLVFGKESEYFMDVAKLRYECLQRILQNPDDDCSDDLFKAKHFLDNEVKKKKSVKTHIFL